MQRSIADSMGKGRRMTTTIHIPEIHWCREHSMWCIHASIWNECRLTACNKKWLKEIKRKVNKMTNREWIESLSDEELADVLRSPCCNGYCIHKQGCDGNCGDGVTMWLQAEHKEPKKELTAAQLYGVFRKGFQDRRAISLEEAEKIIKGVFEDEKENNRNPKITFVLGGTLVQQYMQTVFLNMIMQFPVRNSNNSCIKAYYKAFCDKKLQIIFITVYGSDNFFGAVYKSLVISPHS